MRIRLMFEWALRGSFQCLPIRTLDVVFNNCDIAYLEELEYDENEYSNLFNKLHIFSNPPANALSCVAKKWSY
jgi:hypothetical protein